MIDHWSGFARVGTPSSPALRWPSYGESHAVHQLRPGTDGAVDLASEHQCGFWASIDGRSGG